MQTFKYQIYCPDFEYEIGLFDVMSIYFIENENFVNGNHISNSQLFIIIFCISFFKAFIRHLKIMMNNYIAAGC